MKPPPIVRKPTAVFHQTGPIELGKGKITGVIALTLGGLAVMAVLAFHFPEYLTTPNLRKKYDVNVLREILLVGMVIAGGLALANLIRRRNRWLNGTALALICVAVAMGGHRVPVGDFPDNTPYIGLDWFILDLLGSSMVFILIEKMFPLHREQPVFRPHWQVDFTHFIVNHLLVGLALLIVNFAIHRLFGWLVYAPLQKWIGGLPFFAELFLVLLVADLVQYWTHRAYHEIPVPVALPRRPPQCRIHGLDGGLAAASVRAADDARVDPGRALRAGLHRGGDERLHWQRGARWEPIQGTASRLPGK